MSRIPELMDDSESAMFLWWRQMAMAGLAFHPDDDPYDITGCRTGDRVFTDDEAFEVSQIVARQHTMCGDLIYTAALQATEDREITEARQDAIATWNGPDIQVSPYAEVEKVSGGFWVEARCWVNEA